MTTRSFSDAVGYVERNEADWRRMIDVCWNEWIGDMKQKSKVKFYVPDVLQFKADMLRMYGIKCFLHNDKLTWDYHVVDHTKYMFFQVKYAK